jgi:outer membrane protein assembly factor BamB
LGRDLVKDSTAPVPLGGASILANLAFLFRSLSGIALLSLLAVACDFRSGTSDPETGASPAPAQVGDWPMYGHDLGRTSFSPEETTIDASNLGRLSPRWASNIGMGPLPASSAPSVAGGRVYVGSSVPSGPNFRALNAATGEPVWNAEVGHGGLDGVGIGATAAIAGGVVVAGGGDGAYYGLDAASGRLLWRHDLDAGRSGYAWSSPLVLNGRAYVGVASEFDNPSVRGEVRALDLATGALLARVGFVPEGLRGAGIWNSVTASADSRTLFVATGEDYEGYDGPLNRALVSLDALTLGVRQANKQGVTDIDQDWGTTPVRFGDAQGRALVGANHKNGVFYAYAQDGIAAGPVWSRAVGVSPGMMPAYDPGRGAGGTLLIVGDNGVLFGVDPASGRDRWPPLSIGFMYGNLAAANGLAFVNSEGRVFVVDVASGRVLRLLTPASTGPTYSGVAIANGLVYWLAGPILNAWGLS